MPVPVTVTHVKGKGLGAATADELPTEGPFARAKAAAAEPSAAAPSAAAGAAPAQPAAEEDAPYAGPSISVQDLAFSFPGLGARCRWPAALLPVALPRSARTRRPPSGALAAVTPAAPLPRPIFNRAPPHARA